MHHFLKSGCIRTVNGIPVLNLTKSYNTDKYNASLLLFLQTFCHSISLVTYIKLFVHYRSDILSGILIFIIQPCLPDKFPALLVTRCFISYLILINLFVCKCAHLTQKSCINPISMASSLLLLHFAHHPSILSLIFCLYLDHCYQCCIEVECQIN